MRAIFFVIVDLTASQRTDTCSQATRSALWSLLRCRRDRKFFNERFTISGKKRLNTDLKSVGGRLPPSGFGIIRRRRNHLAEWACFKSRRMTIYIALSRRTRSRYSLCLKRNSLLVKMSHDCLRVGDSQVCNRVCSILCMWGMINQIKDKENE